MSQAMDSNVENDIKAEAPLIELIDNQKKILTTRLNRDIIMKFVKMLKENKNEKFVNLLRALCVCDGEAVVKNQTEMSLLIIKDKKNCTSLIHQQFRKNAYDHFEINIFEYQYKYSDIWIKISEFQRKSSERDDSEAFNYFLSMIHLLADLCLQRNYVAIDFLKNIYHYELCFGLLSDSSLPLKLRTAFAKLLNTLWIDKNPYQSLNLPRYLFSWDDIHSTVYSEISYADLDHTHANQFNDLKSFLKSYYLQLAKEGCTKIYETEANIFSSSLLETTFMLVNFGLFTSIKELEELTRPLLVLLNGMRDTISEGEFFNFQKFMRNPEKASLRKRLAQKESVRPGNEEKSPERYNENEDNLIVMNCKNQICEILQVIMKIDDDLNVKRFLFDFKKAWEKEKDNDHSHTK